MEEGILKGGTAKKQKTSEPRLHTLCTQNYFSFAKRFPLENKGIVLYNNGIKTNTTHYGGKQMKSNDLHTDEIIKCFHCGNETPMKKVGEYSWGSRDLKYSEIDFLYKYELFACPVCSKVTLRQTYADETMIYDNGCDQMICGNEKTILYPPISVESSSIPPKVKEAYEAALKTKSIDKYVCLMALRRTLELLLKGKGATKWGLKDKIEEIAAKGLLPDTLKEASSLAKTLGDTAVHDKELEIDQYDVESMADFIGFIIEYLYVIPDKISTYKQRLDAKSTSENKA